MKKKYLLIDGIEIKYLYEGKQVDHPWCFFKEIKVPIEDIVDLSHKFFDSIIDKKIIKLKKEK